MKFQQDTTLNKILSEPYFAQMDGQFVSSAIGDWFQDKRHLTLARLQNQNPTWDCKDIIYGLNHLQEIALGKKQYVYPIRDGVNLIHLSAKEKKSETYAILNAGGAYGAVCTLMESLPVAAKLNELGIDCFCLNYRTADESSFRQGLMPKPLDDLAAAWSYIKERERQFGVCTEKYIVGGFSAGGHLTAMWGTPHRGARSYGIPNPKALLLAYPLVGLEHVQGPAANIIRTGMLGVGYTQEKVLEYSANRHVDAEYPAVYLVQALDDDTVPWQDAKDLETALMVANVQYRMERVESGGHGFGLGSITPADGWVERAIKFLEDMI